MRYRSSVWQLNVVSIEEHSAPFTDDGWSIFKMIERTGRPEYLIIWQRADVRKTQTRRFVPPTLEEVQAFIKEKNYTVDANEFFRYYAERDWENKNGKPIKNWKQTMREVWASGVRTPQPPKEDYLKPKS